jgi:serine/threonine protein kinase
MLVFSGKYEVIQLLGKGGNGEVYLVWSTETNKFYALKTIRSDLAEDREVRKAFRNEARAWITMNEHPNVAKAYFFEEIEPHMYVTMAVIEGDDDGRGPSLADKLNTSYPSMENLCVWFCQVADGLKHAYMNGIRAHRDIKPGNILVTREGVAKISDFGLAGSTNECFTDRWDRGGGLGTPLFMSPEQFVNATSCDQRSDIYSLGVTLYQAASGGLLPFVPRFSPRTRAEVGRFFAEVRYLHENATPEPITSPFWPVIAKCLNKNPDDRFYNIDEFRAELVDIASQHHVIVPERAKETTDFWVLRDQGNSLMRLRRYEEAIKCFDSFLAVMPDESATFNRAVCLENLGRFGEALEVYEYFAKRDDIKGLVNIGNCLRALGRKREALDYAKRAVALKEDDVDCWIAMGNAAFSFEDWEGAMAAYLNAHRLDSSAPTPSYNLGLAALRSGRDQIARNAFITFMATSMSDDDRRGYVEKQLQRLEDEGG